MMHKTSVHLWWRMIPISFCESYKPYHIDDMYVCWSVIHGIEISEENILPDETN